MMAHFKPKKSAVNNTGTVYTVDNYSINNSTNNSINNSTNYSTINKDIFHKKEATFVESTISDVIIPSINTFINDTSSHINVLPISTFIDNTVIAKANVVNIDNVELINDISPINTNTDSLNTSPINTNSLNIPFHQHSELKYSLPTGAVPKTNTHHYDNQLLDNEIIPKVIKEISTVSDNKKRKKVKDFVLNLINTVVTDVPEKNEISIRYLTSIVNDWGNSNNYDNTNNLSADDIMYVLSVEWKNLELSNGELIQDFSKNFFIQCMDMQTGPCPQGRVIRLWQLAAIFLEWFPLTSDDIII